jgi:hydrogenase maturation factor HypF (carbamoyltransferase family)
MNIFKQKPKCLICEKKCGKVYTVLKYSYENDSVGEAYICEECSKEYDVENMNSHGEPL